MKKTAIKEKRAHIDKRKRKESWGKINNVKGKEKEGMRTEMKKERTEKEIERKEENMDWKKKKERKWNQGWKTDGKKSECKSIYRKKKRRKRSYVKKKKNKCLKEKEYGGWFLLEFIPVLMQTNHCWFLRSLKIDAKQVESSATFALGQMVQILNNVWWWFWQKRQCERKIKLTPETTSLSWWPNVVDKGCVQCWHQQLIILRKWHW